MSTKSQRRRWQSWTKRRNVLCAAQTGKASKPKRVTQSKRTEIAEMEMADSRVDGDNNHILDLVMSQLNSVGQGQHLTPSWWSQTMDSLGFGHGISGMLDGKAPADDSLFDKRFKEAVGQLWKKHPADRRVAKLTSYLRTASSLGRQELQYLLDKSVEQKGLARPLSQQMVWQVALFFWRHIA